MTVEQMAYNKARSRKTIGRSREIRTNWTWRELTSCLRVYWTTSRVRRSTRWRRGGRRRHSTLTSLQSTNARRPSDNNYATRWMFNQQQQPNRITSQATSLSLKMAYNSDLHLNKNVVHEHDVNRQLSLQWVAIGDANRHTCECELPS